MFRMWLTCWRAKRPPNEPQRLPKPDHAHESAWWGPLVKVVARTSRATELRAGVEMISVLEFFVSGPVKVVTGVFHWDDYCDCHPERRHEFAPRSNGSDA